jgi:ABC-type transporter Mla maintaining outer membrane lipid asymmetry ATPase subunit MlaF
MVIVTHKYKNNFTVIDEIYCLFLSNGKIKLIEYLAQINKFKSLWEQEFKEPK